MRKILLCVITFSVVVFANSINWIVDIDKAQKLAKKENKIIMVYVEAKHCPWCEKMKATTLSDKDVVRNLNRDYISLKVDADSPKTQKLFGNVAITPTTMFFSPNGDALEMLEGYQELEFFFWGMGKAEKKFKALEDKKWEY